MKKTTLILAFALVAIFAWAGNKTECTMKVQGNATMKEVKGAKQNREQKSTERDEALYMIYDINYFCKKLTNDIKAFEAADSLNQIVWKHRDNLNKLSEATLEQFLSKMVSMDNFLQADMTAMNTATWKDSTCKEVVANANQCIYIKNVITKLYEDIFWKKQRVFDAYFVVAEYCKEPAETASEAVKRLLDTPDVCSYIGKQHTYYIGMMKGSLEMLEKINSKSKKLMCVTDEELYEKFASDQTDQYNFHYKVESFAE